MRVKNSTQRFAAFVEDLQESFGGDFRGQTRQRLKELLKKDAEKQMADYLGLKWHERSKPSDLYRRGLRGKKLQLVVTDGCPGLARAIETVYPRVRHQRCWVHKMRVSDWFVAISGQYGIINW